MKSLVIPPAVAGLQNWPQLPAGNRLILPIPASIIFTQTLRDTPWLHPPSTPSTVRVDQYESQIITTSHRLPSQSNVLSLVSIHPGPYTHLAPTL